MAVTVEAVWRTILSAIGVPALKALAFVGLGAIVGCRTEETEILRLWRLKPGVLLKAELSPRPLVPTLSLRTVAGRI